MKKRLVTEDGRMAEKVVKEDNVQGGTRRVTEVYVEPKPEKKLQKRITEFSKPVTHRRDVDIIDEETGETRVVEYTKPVVHRREYEVLDEFTGEIIEKKVDNIAIDESKVFKGSSKAFDWRKDMEQEETRKDYVTKKDLHESIVMLAELLKEHNQQEEEDRPQEYQPQVSMQSVHEGAGISAQALIEERLSKKKSPFVGIFLWAVISIQIAILGFLVFKMAL